MEFLFLFFYIYLLFVVFFCLNGLSGECDIFFVYMFLVVGCIVWAACDTNCDWLCILLCHVFYIIGCVDLTIGYCIYYHKNIKNTKRAFEEWEEDIFSLWLIWSHYGLCLYPTIFSLLHWEEFRIF